MDTKFTIKPENIIEYEIERNDAFPALRTALDEGIVREITEHNMKFEKETLIPYIMQYSFPCSCQMPKINERTMKRAQILNQRPMAPVIEQEDIDMRIFAPIVSSMNGKKMSVETLVCQCKQCKQISVFGDLIPFANMLAEATSNHLTMLDQYDGAHESEACDGTGCATCGHSCESADAEAITKPESGYVLEDAETGEMTPMSDLIRTNLDVKPEE